MYARVVRALAMPRTISRTQVRYMCTAPSKLTTEERAELQEEFPSWSIVCV